MRFAYSPCSLELRTALQRAHASDVAAGKHWLALLDGSMLDLKRLKALEEKFGVRADETLAGSPLGSFGRQGPLSVSLPSEASALIAALVQLCAGKPGLSFVRPRGDAAKTTTALRWLSLARTSDGAELHCRFADTRVTPSLLDVLSPVQRACVADGIERWTWPNRLGDDIESRALSAGQRDSEETPSLVRNFDLNDLQYAHILGAAEADMVFQMLAEQMPDLLPVLPAGQLHARIDRMLAAARARGLEDLPDLFQWTVIGLTTYDRFDTHPALATQWEPHDRAPRPFGDWARQWPEDIWLALEAAATQASE